MICSPTFMVVEPGQGFMEACVEGFAGNQVVTDCDPVYWEVPPPPEDPKIDIEKHMNGHDADKPPGPMLPVGSKATFTYEVTNTGKVPLENIVVTDNVVGGPNFMKACVKGMNGGRRVKDCDPVHYKGVKKMKPAWLGDHVSYKHSGKGASDVTIDLYEADDHGKRVKFLSHTRTDAHGEYGFHPDPGCYVLVFIAPYRTEFVGGGKFLELRSCVESGETDDSLDAVLRKLP